MDNQRFMKYYAPTANFQHSNPNPRWKDQKGMIWHTADCCIRALALATDANWLKAYDYLSNRARRDFAVPNDGGFFRRWLTESGAVWQACKAVKGKKRMTVLQFAQAHPNGRYVISIANHNCACVDGVIKDAWNPSEYCVVGYLDMSNFKFD